MSSSNWPSIRSSIRAAVILPFVIIILLCSTIQADGRRRSSKDVKRERQRTEQQIAATKKQIKQNDKETARQLNKLNTLKANIALTGDTIRIINNRLDSVNKAISIINDSIEALGKQSQALKASYAKSLRTMRSRRQGMNDLTFIFSARSFGQAWRRIRYLREIASSSTRQAKRIKETSDRLVIAQSQLDTLKAAHTSVLSRLNATRAKMSAEQKNADILVADLRKQGKSLNRELQRRRELAEKLARELDRVIEQETREAEEKARREAEERARIAREAEEKRKKEEEAAQKRVAEEAAKKKAAEEAAKQKHASKQPSEKPAAKPEPKPTPPPAPKPEPNPVATPKPTSKTEPSVKTAAKQVPLSGSFAKNKGKLLFPVAGRYVITSNFGTNDHPELSKVKIDNLGIDIEVASGSSARSIFEGVVSSIFRLDGYHNIVIVRHGEYLSVYAGIDRLSVKKGDKVATGQTLGTIYSDPDDENRTTLHFEIRHEKQKLNPVEWVR